MKTCCRNWTLLAATGLIALGLGISATIAQEQPADDEGTVVQVGPDGAQDPLPGALDPRPRMLQRQFQPFLVPGDPNEILRQRRPPSPYYIGVAAEPVTDALRAHVDLPDDAGLIVQEVFEGSPADEAGLKQYDILVAADGDELHGLDDLINKVDEHGRDNLTQITLDVIRHGQPQTVWVTPTERPEQDQLVQPGFGGGMPQLPQMDPNQRQLLDRMLQGRGGFNFQGFGFNQVPGNVSVQVQKQGDEPTKITVQRDGDTWEVIGDDPESLNQLPEDLRPMVESMLKGEQQFAPPMQTPGFGRGMTDDLRQRVQQMEDEMRQLREQLQESTQEN